MARLKLAYVKIDRDILQHEATECTIRYVLERVKQSRTHPTKVVIEGFDSESRISLADLYKLGVDYVQGYIVGKASSSHNFLDEDTKKYLAMQIRGNDEK